MPPRHPSLAVIGGGPSIAKHVDEIRDWEGEIWAINGAFHWCERVGIKARFFTVDPAPIEAFRVDGPFAEEGAILSTACAPELVESVIGPVEFFPYGEWPSGSSTASVAPMAAAKRGHSHITMFGCESSFESTLHAYDWATDEIGRMLIECGGCEYLTTPQLLMQAEYLSEIARGVPGYVTVVGDGLLPAMIASEDWDCRKVSRAIMESLSNVA